MFELSDDDIPKTSDIVFIVEAKSCNHNLTVNKNIPTIISALEKAFADVGLQNARYISIQKH